MNADKERPGCLWPALWLVGALLGTVVGLALVGLAASGSESAGVSATYAAAFPLGALWSGAIVALAMHFINKGGKAARFGAPLGCGCLGGALLFGLIFVFFVAIFPSL